MPSKESFQLLIFGQDASGWTPLMIASSLKEEDGLVNLLLSKGADPTVTNNSGQVVTPSNLVNTIFHYSSFPLRKDSLMVFRTQTALHLTTSKANLATARTLISQGASARVKDRRGQLPLHRAAAIGTVPLIELMLANNSPLNATDISGLTALHHGNLIKIPGILTVCRS